MLRLPHQLYLDHDIRTFASNIGALDVFMNDEFLFPEVNNGWHFPTNKAFHNGDYIVGALQAYTSRGVKPQHLVKVWRIPMETARQTIDTTSQRYVCTPGSQLSRNYSTGD